MRYYYQIVVPCKTCDCRGHVEARDGRIYECTECEGYGTIEFQEHARHYETTEDVRLDYPDAITIELERTTG